MEYTEDEIRYKKNIIYTTDYEDEPDSRGLGYAYFEQMLENNDLVAQVDGYTGETDTFASLLKRCVRTAIWLKEMGLQYGDVVSSCTYNHLNSGVPHISSYFIGAKIAAFDPTLSVREAAYLFRQVTPKVIFTGTESVKLIENVIQEVGANTKIVVFGATDKHVPFSDLISPKPNETSFKPVEVQHLKDIALILFSSGTTGLPKGVCFSHRAMLHSVAAIKERDYRDVIVYSNDSPFWNVFSIYLHQSIFGKSVRLVSPTFDYNNPWSIFTYNVNYVMLDLTRMLTLCHTPKPKDIDLSSLGTLVVSGTTISEDQMAKARETFPGVHVSQSYGLSEVFCGVAYFDPTKPKHVQLAIKKTGSCGLPRRGICLKVVDPDTEKVLGPNQNGEIRLKTSRQLSGYHNIDSSGVWDSDGWLRTGDYGYYDQDYCIYVIDRIKEMFEYRYKHITPATIESVINTHPAVFRSVVIGVPHYMDNHHPMALIIVKPDCSNVTTEEIEKYVEVRVEDPFRLRAGVKFVKSFPLTQSGKVNRLRLKEMVRDKQI
uniref:Luciferin 4-monooxygenase n=1 Tax=Photinus pyralis TaxID=7054 RepID=A0A1Y1M1H7_PHOPY